MWLSLKNSKSIIHRTLVSIGFTLIPCSIQFCSWKLINKLAWTGADEESIATSSIWSKMLPWKVKCITEVAILKGFRCSSLVNFISRLFSKIKFIAISIASDNGIFVNKFVTSNEIKKFMCYTYRFDFSLRVKLSFVEYSDGIWGERREPKYWTRLQL